MVDGLIENGELRIIYIFHDASQPEPNNFDASSLSGLLWMHHNKLAIIGCICSEFPNSRSIPKADFHPIPL
jgi:hypothetical protein